MKKLHLLLLFLCFSLANYAQVPISLELHKKLQEVDENESVPLIIQGTDEEVNAFLGIISTKPLFKHKNIYRANLTKDQIAQAKPFDIRLTGGGKGQILNDSVRVLNGVVPLHEGATGLPQAYKGKNVVVGILDSGLDYRHQDFYDADGNSRIHSIWDQRKTGTPPTGFGYGLLCDAASIADGTCPSFDEEWNRWYSHGTHVAGIAAGFDQEFSNKFTGMAPEATIIAVALDFDNFYTSVIDGAKYIYDTAESLGMPAVINLSAGDYSGPHDGKNLVTYALNDLITESNGRSFVAAAGNGGAEYLHAKHIVNTGGQFTYFNSVGSGSELRYEWVLYADSVNFEHVDFKFQADLKTTFEKQGETSLLNVLADFADPGNGVLEQSIDVFNNAGALLGKVNLFIEKFEKRYGIRVLIDNTSDSHYWRFHSEGIGVIDFYTGRVTNTSTMIRSDQLPADFSELASYASPDLQQNTVGYFSASHETISVANYVSKNSVISYNGDPLTDNSITLYDKFWASSIGPNRDGYLKPDISSTGTWVSSAANAEFIQHRIDINAYVASVTQDGKHFRNRGTSMSSPAVAGGIALMLQRNPTLSSAEIKELVLSNAVRDDFTTATENEQWGYGKFNINQVFQNSDLVLPLKWGAFTVEKQNTNDALLNWATLSEHAVSHFNIKRSYDGLSWVTLSDIPAENNETGASYQYTDENLPYNQTIYYRIESVDFDLTKDSTNIETIVFVGSNRWMIAQNPVQNELMILSDVNNFPTGIVQIELIAINGEVLMSKEINNYGVSQNISVSELPQGSYIITVKQQGKLLLQDKVIIVR